MGKRINTGFATSKRERMAYCLFFLGQNILWGYAGYVETFLTDIGIAAATAALILLVLFKLIKKVVVIIIIAVLVMVGLNALGLYNMRTDPKDLVAQVSKVAADNSETIVTATKDLFYQASGYVTEINPVQSVVDFAAGEDSYWYMAGKNDEVDFSQEVFQGYKVTEVKEVGEFKAYHLVKNK